MSRILIVNNWKDEEKALTLLKVLKKSELNAFLWYFNIQKQKKGDEIIIVGISPRSKRDNDFFIFLVSKNFNIVEPIKYLIGETTTLETNSAVTVLIDTSDVPSYLQKFPKINLTDWDGSQNHLTINELKVLLSGIRS